MTDSTEEPVYQYVEVCADTSGTDCIYMVQSSWLPALSIGDAMLILGAAVWVLAVAWSAGVLYRTLFVKTR